MGGLVSKGNHLDEVVFLSNQNITASDLGIIQKDTECKDLNISIKNIIPPNNLKNLT